MYSNQDTLMTAAELAQVPTPAPMGRFHQPVGFGDYLELVKHRLKRAGIDIAHEEYVTTADSQTFFGSMAIRVDGFERDDMELTLGIRGSHNQKVPRGLCLGNRVIVCSNLMFNGDLANVSTKQTSNIWSRLPAMVDQAVAQLPQMAQREEHRIGTYKQFDMRPRWGDAALVEMHRRGAMSGAQLTRAIDEWDRPSFEEHGEDGFTAWRLLNAVTEAQKPSGDNCNMDTVRRRTAIASSFLDEVVGI
jgi:hypothetical protein